MMPVSEHDGFTLIELLTALLILSLLALLSYRGLSTVLDARQQIRLARTVVASGLNQVAADGELGVKRVVLSADAQGAPRAITVCLQVMSRDPNPAGIGT